MSAVGAPTGGHFRLRDLRAKVLPLDPGVSSRVRPNTRPGRIELMKRFRVFVLAESVADIHGLDLAEIISTSTQTHICKARRELGASFYAVGITFEAAGRMIGCHRLTVREWVIALGVPIRPRGRHTRSHVATCGAPVGSRSGGRQNEKERLCRKQSRPGGIVNKKSVDAAGDGCKVDVRAGVA